MTRATTEDDLSKLEAGRDAYRHIKEPPMQDKFDLRQAVEVLRHYPNKCSGTCNQGRMCTCQPDVPYTEDQSEGLTLAENLMFWGLVAVGFVVAVVIFFGFLGLVAMAWMTFGPA